MITVESERRDDGYVLGRTDTEYDRLRAQSRVWEAATGRLLDQVALAPGASCLDAGCLDAGCGPGETMRLLAERVGRSGHVLGVDIDATLGRQTVTMLHDAGHRQCQFARVDLTSGEQIPGAPFDVVYARLLLYHLPGRVAVLRSLWNAVAPGGHLLVQDYDLQSVSVQPALNSFEEIGRAITTETMAATTLANFTRDAERFPERPTLWPLLIGAWKRKPHDADSELMR